MPLLAIDTAANLCAACIWDAAKGVAMASRTRDIGTGHAEQLMAVITEVLDDAGLAYADLDRLGVVVGPGSFTGVRVGVSTIRGLALALKIPAVGVSTLEGLAAEARASHPGRPVLAVIDARRGQVYSALYAPDGSLLAEPAVLGLERTLARLDVLPDTVLVGSGAHALGAANRTLAGTGATAAIETYAALAAARAPGSAPVPLYLRGADAKPQAGFILPGRDG